MASPELPRRVADVMFRRDMVGPFPLNIVASTAGLLLVEKLILDYVLPPWAPLLESYILTYGLFTVLCAGTVVDFGVAYWGLGGLFTLPQLLGTTWRKIQPSKGLDVQAFLHCMPLVFLNFVIGCVVGPVCLYAFLPPAAFDMRALPSTGTLMRDVLVWIAVDEVMFFYTHRWLHLNKTLYAKIHKMHHMWTAPNALVTIYCHPFEHLLCNIGPLLLGPLLCGSHVAAIAVFMFLGLAHTLSVHSGYWICDDNGMHDEHHARFNVNFGVLGVLDAWYGSYSLPEGAQPVRTKFA